MSMLEKLSQNPSIASARQKYEMMPSRDRLALKILGAVVAVLLLYVALWAPAKAYLDESMTDLEEKKALLALVQENKLKLKKMSGQSGSSVQKLDSQQLVSSVTNLAIRQGLNLKRFEPSGENEVKVWLEEASFDKLVQWLAIMNKSINVHVEQISLEKEDAEGLVSARITLSS